MRVSAEASVLTVGLAQVRGPHLPGLSVSPEALTQAQPEVRDSGWPCVRAQAAPPAAGCCDQEQRQSPGQAGPQVTLRSHDTGLQQDWGLHTS